MKSLIATACLVALTFAEPPPSNSYLPPSAGRSGGYPQGPQGTQGLGGQAFGAAPQVIAARALDHGHGADHGTHAGHDAGGRGAHGVGGHGAGLARNGAHGHGAQAKFGAGQGHGDQGYDQNASPFGRNALEDASGEPASYNFGYMVNDYQEGTDFGHHEERQDERAEGEYHVVLPDGRKQTVSYEADEGGFKPRISYEDSDALSRSGGYDANANNVQGHDGNHGNGYSNGGHGNHGNARSGY